MDGIADNASTTCGATFSSPGFIQAVEPYDPTDIAAPETAGASPIGEDAGESTASPAPAPGSVSGDCGDFDTHCAYGYTFMRGDTQIRSTADQADQLHDYVYLLYDPSIPGTHVPSGTTYDRNDPRRRLGNCEDRSTVASIDAFGATGSTATLTWGPAVRLSEVTSNPSWEQSGGREVPFGGDYLYVSSVGAFSYGTWTGWRVVVPGVDAREDGDGDADGADVLQCRTVSPDGTVGADTCPFAGGLDQNIYGDLTPWVTAARARALITDQFRNRCCGNPYCG